MNKFITKIAVAFTGIAMAIGVGVALGGRSQVKEARAADQTYQMTIDSSATNGSNNVHWTSATATLSHSDVSWSASMSGSTSITAQTTYAQLGSRNNPATSITLSTSGIAGTIKSVAATCSSYGGAFSIGVTVGGTAYTMSSASTPSGDSTALAARTGTGSSSGTIVITFTGGDGRRAFYISRITVVYNADSVPDSITRKASHYDVYTDGSLDLSTCVIAYGTGTLSFAASAENDGYFTLSGTYNKDLTPSKAGGPVTITASKGSATTTFTVTILSIPVYSRITSDTNLTPGTTFILGYYGGEGTTVGAVDALSGGYFTVTNVTLSDNTIQTHSAMVFTLGGSSGAWTFKNGNNYYGLSGTSNGSIANAKTSVSESDTGYLWTISFDSNKVVLSPQLAGTGNLEYNSSTSKISNYAKSGQKKDIYMYAILAPYVEPSTSSANIYTPNAPTSATIGLTYKNITPGSNSSATSSNTSIIPDANCALSRTTNNYDTLTVSSKTGATGSVTVTVTLVDSTDNTKTCSCSVAVTVANNAIDLESISVTTSPTTSTFYIGNKLDLSGMVVSASWSNDTTSDVTSSCVLYLGDGTGSAYNDEALTALDTTVTIKYTFSGTTKSTTQAISVVPFSYSKASSINGGDKVVIASGLRYLSSIQNDIGVASDFGNGIYPTTTNTYTVVAGASDGTVAFKQGDNYISWSTNNNYLRTSTTLNSNSSWTVSISENIATIANVADTGRIIKYGNGDRFVAYKNESAVNVNLWKLNGASGQSAAEDFAEEFTAIIMDDICKKHNASFDDDMFDYWDAESEEYAALSPEAKAYIASKTANASGDAVEKMLYDYNYIYNKYGEDLLLANFLGRVEAAKASRIIRPFEASESSSTMIIVVVTSMVGILAMGGFLMLKKRKEQ